MGCSAIKRMRTRQGGAAAFSLAAAMVAGFGAAGDAAAQGRAAQVIVDRVETRVIGDRTPLLGQVVARVESDVAARVSGVVEEVFVEVGDATEQGAAIAVLDDTLLQIDRDAAAAALAQAEADVASAQAQLGLARQVYNRASDLQDSVAFSRGAMEDNEKAVATAESALARSQAARAVTKATLARAETRLERARIASPFDGVVIEKRVAPGQFIAEGAAAATLVDMSSMELEAQVPVELIDGVRPGVEIGFVLGAAGRRAATDPNVSFDGVATVRAVIPREASNTRTRPVRLAADLEARADAAIAGAAVTIFVPVGAPRETLTAPKDALVQGAGGWMVFVAAEQPNEDSDAPPSFQAAPRPVRVGQATGARVEILSGLEAGQLVVIRGNERLRPGQAIAFEPPAAPEPSPTDESRDEQAGEVQQATQKAAAPSGEAPVRRAAAAVSAD